MGSSCARGVEGNSTRMNSVHTMDGTVWRRGMVGHEQQDAGKQRPQACKGPIDRAEIRGSLVRFHGMGVMLRYVG